MDRHSFEDSQKLAAILIRFCNDCESVLKPHYECPDPHSTDWIQREIICNKVSELRAELQLNSWKGLSSIYNELCELEEEAPEGVLIPWQKLNK